VSDRRRSPCTLLPSDGFDGAVCFQPFLDESIFSECLVVAMFEILKPAPQLPVHLRDGLGHAAPEVRSDRLPFLMVLLRGQRLPPPESFYKPAADCDAGFQTPYEWRSKLIVAPTRQEFPKRTLKKATQSQKDGLLAVARQKPISTLPDTPWSLRSRDAS
jgi:hypothetical protein